MGPIYARVVRDNLVVRYPQLTLWFGIVACAAAIVIGVDVAVLSIQIIVYIIWQLFKFFL